MSEISDNFMSQVLNSVGLFRDDKWLMYPEYLKLDESKRRADETSVVHDRFTKQLLSWLGYNPDACDHEHHLNPREVVDFMVRDLTGMTAFIIECKSTTTEYDHAKHIEQMLKYIKSTAAKYCIWTNGKSIVVIEFSSEIDGHISDREVLNVDVASLMEDNSSMFSALFGERAQRGIEEFYHMFEAARYNDFEEILKSLEMSEEEWEAQAYAIAAGEDKAILNSFISSSRTALDRLSSAALNQLENAFHKVKAFEQDLDASRHKYDEGLTELAQQMNDALSSESVGELKELRYNLENLSYEELVNLEPGKAKHNKRKHQHWLLWCETVALQARAIHDAALNKAEQQKVVNAYRAWVDNYRVIEDEDDGVEGLEKRRHHAFAEHVGYIFFVRLLAIRVLEDKDVIPRLISRGGIAEWKKILTTYLYGNGGREIDPNLLLKTLLNLLFTRVGQFYRHFSDTPVFDWFVVDDYSLVVTLKFLNRYNFAAIAADIIGYAYEAFVDRTARNRKGHFLTRTDLVDYILDMAGYTGTKIIGRKLADLACGSGSFLVAAARRLHNAIVSSYGSQATLQTKKIALEFISEVKNSLYGMDINPFSCYLAELNLLIQLLEDAAVLIKAGEPVSIDHFQIYNCNSLLMPNWVMQSSSLDQIATPQDEEEQGREISLLGEGADIKIGKKGAFTYVVGNPPYINRGIITSMRRYKDVPFYKQILSGDENTYLLFLRLASYYCGPGGVISYVIPLTLFADKAGRKARELFSGSEWTIRSLTRFYDEDVLFPGVKQAVCVASFQHLEHEPSYDIEIRGGSTVEQVESNANRIMVKSEQVTDAHLQTRSTRWQKNWLVTNQAEVYEIWSQIRAATSTDVSAVIEGKLTGTKGDVNSTHVKALYTTDKKQGIPLTKSDYLEDYGGWQPYAHLSYNPNWQSAPPHSNTNVNRTRQNIARIVELQEKETVVLLREIANMGMRRRISGTIVARGPGRDKAFVADDTLLCIRTQSDKHQELAYALLGLLTSSVCNYAFSLFSTNNHVSLTSILRMALPQWTEEMQKRLATLAQEIMGYGIQIDEFAHTYGSAKKVEIQGVMKAANIIPITLEQALRSETLQSKPTLKEDARIATLARNGELTVREEFRNGEYEQIIMRVLSENDSRYSDALQSLTLPTPEVARLLSRRLNEATARLSELSSCLASATSRLDAMVLERYGITKPEWIDAIGKGVPWTW